MNINLKLMIPIVNSDGDEKSIKIDSSLFLTPFYAVEEDVVPLFPDFKEENLGILRNMLFNASLTVNRLTEKVDTLNLLSKKELFSLRRDYVICMVTNEMAKRLNSDNVKSQSKSKTLGDFTVSVSETSDSTVLSRIFADSRQCIRELEKLLDAIEYDRILPVDFVKGRYNINNVQANDRLWWLKDLDNGRAVIDGYASNKFWYNGNRYKSASMNRKTSAASAGMTLIEYYSRDLVNEERFKFNP